jgi:protein TonB
MPAGPAFVDARFDADYLRNPAPVYPPMSRRRGEQGEVRLLVAVSAAGVPERIEIRHSSGYPRLDEAAARAVREWRFVPARRGDRPVAASVVVPVVFRLEG